MPCHYPVRAHRLADGSVVFMLKRGYNVIRDFFVPCGQCVGCRLEHSRQWAVRCMHEAKMHDENCFVTLTYNDAHLPDIGDLDYGDFQKFMKRLRKRFKGRKISYFACGEYGENYARPHFHSGLFGVDFPDRVYFKTTASGSKIYTSEILSSVWSDRSGDSIGFASIGDLTFESAGYVARYSMKKSLGHSDASQYEYIDRETGEVLLREKEFIHMSLKPAIGKGFYGKFFSDIFPHDHCVVNGVRTKPPKYYMRLLKEDYPELYEEIQYNRELSANERSADNTEERLLVKEKVLKASVSFLKRELR